MTIRVLRGPARWWVDLKLFMRVALAGIARFGPFGLVRELRKYLKDNRNLLAGSADRYVERDGEVFAASAMPAVSSPRFAAYLLDEIETFNAGRPSPMIFAILAISSRCPYRCKHCYALGELHDDERIDLAAMERCIRGLASRGVGNIFLSGGEPMYRAQELPGLLQRTADDVDAFWLVTTGWHVDHTTLKPLLPHGLKGVVISLDSRNEDEVVRSKGHGDAYQNALVGIRAANDLGLLVCVDSMVTPELLERAEFTAYMDFLASMSVRFVNYFPPHAVGGVEKFHLPTLTNDQLLTLEAYIDEFNHGPEHVKHPIAYSAVIWERRRGCSGGQQFLYTDPEGNVLPCPFLKVPAGNIHDTPIEQIYDEMRRAGEQGGCFGQYEGLETGQRTDKPS